MSSMAASFFEVLYKQEQKRDKKNQEKPILLMFELVKSAILNRYHIMYYEAKILSGRIPQNMIK